MCLIAIEHQLGSGGRDIGQRVAQELQLPYVDQEIVQGVAHKLGISEVIASSLDEKAERVVAQIFSSLRFGLALPMSKVEPEDLIELTDYQQATRDILATIAATRNAVIAGHGANFFLKNRTCFYSIFVYGSVENRVERLMRRKLICRDEALKRLHKSDNEKAYYIKSLYRANWLDPEYYHLVINTSNMNLDSAVKQILTLAK